MSPGLEIRALDRRDWPEVELIYASGIATGHATFEAEPPSWEAFDAGKLPGQRFVAVDDERVLGWVAASSVSERCVYAGVVEHSVYVDPGVQGRGIGRALLDALIASTEEAGIWTIQSGIFLESVPSQALHRAAGFEVVGTRRRLERMTYGPLAGRWRDVVFIERPSDCAGQ